MWLRSGAFAIAGLLIVAGVAGGLSVEDWPRNPAPDPFEQVRARLMAAGRVWVSPACGAAIAPWASRGSLGRRLALRAHSKTEQDQAWNAEFVTALLRAADWDTAQKFRGVSKPCDQTHDVPLFTVTWQAGGAETQALLSFEARCAVLFEADRALGAAWLGDRADTVFALIRRAMPGDSRVQAMGTPAATEPRLDESLISREILAIGTLPEVVKKVRPKYPEFARRSEIEGTVFVRALVGPDGAVQDAFVVRGPKSLWALEEPAVDAVWRWRFKPARKSDGTPVAVWVAVPVRFRLN
jgi:TonB family protein